MPAPYPTTHPQPPKPLPTTRKELAALYQVDRSTLARRLQKLAEAGKLPARCRLTPANVLAIFLLLGIPPGYEAHFPKPSRSAGSLE